MHLKLLCSIVLWAIIVVDSQNQQCDHSLKEIWCFNCFSFIIPSYCYFFCFWFWQLLLMSPIGQATKPNWLYRFALKVKLLIFWLFHFLGSEIREFRETDITKKANRVWHNTLCKIRSFHYNYLIGNWIFIQQNILLYQILNKEK